MKLMPINRILDIELEMVSHDMYRALGDTDIRLSMLLPDLVDDDDDFEEIEKVQYERFVLRTMMRRLIVEYYAATGKENPYV